MLSNDGNDRTLAGSMGVPEVKICEGRQPRQTGPQRLAADDPDLITPAHVREGESTTQSMLEYHRTAEAGQKCIPPIKPPLGISSLRC